MNHDHACELNKVFAITSLCPWPGCQQMGRHCHCGSRGFPLCAGCRHGQHVQHSATEPDTDQPCVCDLCEEAA